MGSRPHTGRFYSPLLDNIRDTATDGKCRVARDGSTPEWALMCILIGVPFVALAVGMQWQLWMGDFVTTGRFPQLDMPRITSAFLGGIAGLIGGSLLSVGILRLLFRTRSH